MKKTRVSGNSDTAMNTNNNGGKIQIGGGICISNSKDHQSVPHLLSPYAFDQGFRVSIFVIQTSAAKLVILSFVFKKKVQFFFSGKKDDFFSEKYDLFETKLETLIKVADIAKNCIIQLVTL